MRLPKLNWGIKSFFNNILNREGPYSIRLYPVGYMCNHDCVMCWRTKEQKSRKDYAKAERNSLKIGEYIRLIRSFPSSVKFVDIVGGGEPLLFKELGKLCKEIKKRNIYGRLITNGALFNKFIINGLKNCTWNEVRISFHAGTKEVYKKINGVDDFEKVKANIKLLVAAAKEKKILKVSMLYVIQRDNIDDMVTFVNLAESLGVDEVEFDYLLPMNTRVLIRKDQQKNILDNLKMVEKKALLKNNASWAIKMLSIHPRCGKSDKYFEDKYCINVQSNLDIQSDGLTMPCCLMPLDIPFTNVRKQSIQEIWNSYRVFRDTLKKGDFCSFCYEMCNQDLPKRLD